MRSGQVRQGHPQSGGSGDTRGAQTLLLHLEHIGGTLDNQFMSLGSLPISLLLLQALIHPRTPTPP